MADTKISADTAATSLADADIFPLVQGGANKNSPFSLLATYIAGKLSAFVASGTGHAKGLVPDPGATAGTTKVLFEDGTWKVPPSGSGSAPQSDYTKTTNPAVTDDTGAGWVAGSEWLNTATGTLFKAHSVASGAAVWRTVGIKDQLQPLSGRWYPPKSAVRQNIAMTAGVISAHPIIIPETVTIAALGVRMITTASGNMKFAVYSSVSGKPGALLGQTASTTNTGSGSDMSAALTTPLTLKPGVYWLSAISDVTPTVVSFSIADALPETTVGAGSINAALAGTAAVSGYKQTIAYATAFADPMGTVTDAVNVPVICYQVA